MLVGGISSIGSFVRFQAPETARAGAIPAPSPSPATVDWEAFGLARRHMAELVRALDRLDGLLDGATRKSAAASVASSSDLGLDPSPATPATLQSVEEVNTAATSFTPFGPDWTGASSALITIDGVYDGSNGSGTLTFDVRRGGTHGQDNLRIRIEDPSGKAIDTFNIQANDPIDEVYTLSNGLSFTLGAGDLVKNDTLTVDVSDSVGSSVNPDKPLDGVRNDDPNLDEGLTVGAGSFTVNGTVIDVFAGDSLNDVLARITQSAAGVTASFDVASERVVLTQTTPGSAPTITFGADSSGFLAATKLAGASVVPGTDHELEMPLASLPQFASVSSGTVLVNGAAIAIDVNADSVLDVIDKLNTSGAGVTASLDASLQRVSIVSDDPKAALVLDSGTTGLFPALNIADGSYQAVLSGRGLSKRRSYEAADALEAIAQSLGKLFSSTLVDKLPTLQSLRTQVQGVLAGVVDAEGASSLSRLGLSLDSSSSGRELLSMDALDRRRFSRALQRDVRELQGILGGAEGLVTRLRGVVGDALQPPTALPPGSFFDRFI